MTSKEARAKIIETAKEYLGAVQGDARHKKIIDAFNKVKPDGWAMTYSAYWCAAYASAIAVLTFGVSIAKKYFPLSANCGTIIKKAKSMGIWEETDSHKPAEGDWLIYDWQDSGRGDNKGDPDHVGIVEKVKAGQLHIIEGNMRGKCGRRVIPVNGRYIRGFVLPNFNKIAEAYTKEKGSKEEPKKEKKKTTKKEYYIVKRGDTLTSIAKKYGTTWKKLQELNDIKDPDVIRTGQKLRVK